MPRLFAAIRPPAPVRDALIDTMEGLPDARWQDEDQLHLTLRFIGEVDSRTAEDLAGALESVSAAPFEVSLRGIGTFERKGRVHTLWAGAAPAPELLALQKKVERACQACGLEPEHRKFAPHVTLARMRGTPRDLTGWLGAHGGFTAGSWPVQDFRLYRSDLAPAGAIYSEVARYPLGR